jgi:hypothetical protein
MRRHPVEAARLKLGEPSQQEERDISYFLFGDSIMKASSPWRAKL